MDRIQAAIEKARQTRRAGSEAPQTRDNGTSVGTAVLSPKDEVFARWASLNEFKPKSRDLTRNRIFTYQASRDGTAFDITRTRTIRQMTDQGWKRLAITSPTDSCGKSTVVLNLAFSLVRQSDLRVIVIETDIRRPTLARALGNRSNGSVGDLLSGKSQFQDCAVRIGDNLAVVTQAVSAGNASDILLSPQTGQTLNEIDALYAPDIMIFDTPPLLVTDDTLAFLKHIDCALLVAAAGKTTIKQIDNCERELAAQTNVLGITLNKVRYMSSDYSGDWYG